MALWKKPFENILGKGENAGNQHFLLFPKCFLLYKRQISPFEKELTGHLQTHGIWTSLTLLSFGKELTVFSTLPTYDQCRLLILIELVSALDRTYRLQFLTCMDRYKGKDDKTNIFVYVIKKNPDC